MQTSQNDLVLENILSLVVMWGWGKTIGLYLRVAVLRASMMLLRLCTVREVLVFVGGMGIKNDSVRRILWLVGVVLYFFFFVLFFFSAFCLGFLHLLLEAWLVALV